MKLPLLRHIEYLLLKTLNKPKTREQLIRELNWKESDQYFYSQMRTMERKGWVKREWYVTDRPFHWFLMYEITSSGIKEIQRSKDFYS